LGLVGNVETLGMLGAVALKLVAELRALAAHARVPSPRHHRGKLR
jgi:hypothetical protein